MAGMRGTPGAEPTRISISWDVEDEGKCGAETASRFPALWLEGCLWQERKRSGERMQVKEILGWIHNMLQI